jgi:hypothetical protein
VLAFAFFILIFAEVHDAAYRWRRVGRNLYEVEACILGPTQGIAHRNYANLLAVTAYQSDFRGVDAPIDTNLFIRRDLSVPPK